MQNNKDLVDSVISAMIERPNDFVIGEYNLTDKKSKMDFWIANGVFFGGVERPFKAWFGIVQSMRFHRAVKQLKIMQAQQSLSLSNATKA